MNEYGIIESLVHVKLVTTDLAVEGNNGRYKVTPLYRVKRQNAQGKWYTVSESVNYSDAYLAYAEEMKKYELVW